MKVRLPTSIIMKNNNLRFSLSTIYPTTDDGKLSTSLDFMFVIKKIPQNIDRVEVTTDNVSRSFNASKRKGFFFRFKIKKIISKRNTIIA